MGQVCEEEEEEKGGRTPHDGERPGGSAMARPSMVLLLKIAVEAEPSCLHVHHSHIIRPSTV